MLKCKPLKFFLVIIVIVLLLADTEPAQTTTATLSGNVTDEQNAAVGGATIKVINTDAGFERTVSTNDSGTFVIPLLPPATYRLTIERSGFAPFEVAEVILNANDQKSLNLRLKVGQIGETVDIMADGSLIDESPSVSTTIDRQFVSNLPLNGRSLQGLISLSPGVVVTASSSQSPGQFSVNGQRTTSNYYTVDGVSANFGTNNFAGFSPTLSGTSPATNVQGSFSNLASIDAIQEFKIQTSTFAPEIGRQPGANVSIVTRGGENKFRGALYEYFRNDIFDANDFFNNLYGFSKPALRYNNFGGTFSGPVILPRFGEGTPYWWKGTDKTFFFFSYEGQRFTLPIGAVSTVVPSLAARSAAANQVARNILNAFPTPNGAEIRTAAGGLTGGAIFTSSYSEPSSADAWSIRIDHNLTKSFTLFGRYNQASGNSDLRGGTNLSQLTRLRTKTKTVTLGSTQVFSSRMVNELRLNGSFQDGTARQVFDGFGGGITPPEELFFPSTVFDVPRRGIISLSGLAGNSGLGFTSVSIGTDELNRQRQINVIDNFSYSAGSHQLKFGVDYRWLSPILAPAEFLGNVTFASIATVNSGIARISAQKRIGYTLQFPTYSFYGQDTWKVNPRLTLTYGLRWEINPAPTARGKKDILTVREVRGANEIDFSYLQLAPAGTPVYPTRFNNFAPRFGASYQLRQNQGRELVVRGGIGVFYELGQNGFGNIGFPYLKVNSQTSGTFPISPSLAVFTPPNFNLSPTNRALVTAADADYNLPKVYQWNLTAEQSLGSNQTISAAYVAALGRGLLKNSTIILAAAPNPAAPSAPFSPNFSQINMLLNGATSDYHSMQIQFTRRLTKGFQANFGYTWSRSIDSGSSDLEVNPLSRVVDDNINRGDSDFDIRHSLTGGMTYQIPTPKWNAVSKAILGDWSLNSIFFARSGLPFNVVADAGESARILGSYYERRPDLNPGVPIWITDTSIGGGRRLNPAAFSFPTTATQAQGSFGRNVLRGPGAWQVDIGLHRRFAVTEKAGLQFRWEIFNVLNHTNFSNPNFLQLYLPGDPSTRVVDVNNQTFGIITQMLGRGLGGGGNSGGFNPIFQVGGPRSMQFALRLDF